MSDPTTSERTMSDPDELTLLMTQQDNVDEREQLLQEEALYEFSRNEATFQIVDTDQDGNPIWE